jgi:hypothetical protein
MGKEEEGKYCTVCGGVVPDSIKIRRILIEGKEIGIDQLDMILGQVRELHLHSEETIKNELLKRVKVFNYIPSRKFEAYGAALWEEYRRG